MHLDGLGIMVKDMAVMVRFYRDVLGFEITEEEDAENVYLTKDGTVFMLYRRPDLEQMMGRKLRYADGIQGHFETALSVENFAEVDRAFARAVSMGARPVMEPVTEPWGQRTCYIADPEGNLIEIGSFRKE